MSDEYVIQKEAHKLFTQGLEYLKTNRLNPDFPKEGKIIEDDQLKIAQYRVLIIPAEKTNSQMNFATLQNLAYSNRLQDQHMHPVVHEILEKVKDPSWTGGFFKSSSLGKDVQRRAVFYFRSLLPRR
ncbi:hypothetical protein [Shimazuella alba]|uniref:Uncharacterized protein n=1 Tax=Shimazuella alba TaxID=2690964 RepID=A0A6I4VPK2_9BACL|nr:hypothetical protein [Shimazuella alba]MXQ52993.1 hypothetical protein [Shimazuella alba]